MPKPGVLLREFMWEERNLCSGFTLIYAQGRFTALYGTMGNPKYNGEYKQKRIIEGRHLALPLELCLIPACQNLLWWAFA